MHDEHDRFILDDPDYYFETESGLRFNIITEAQGKLLDYKFTDTSASDITISFSSNRHYHYGDLTDKDATLFDFESVLLHEIAHGLGMTSELISPVELPIDPETREQRYNLTQTELNVISTGEEPI